MFSKYTMALAALLLVGGSSLAGAYDDPENKLGDRYLTLEQGGRMISARTAGAYRTGPRMDVEDPESKVGDRYPSVDASYQSAAANRVILRRTVTQTARGNQNIEDPESKIADRYLVLEHAPQYAQARAFTVANTTRTANSVMAAKKKSGNRS